MIPLEPDAVKSIADDVIPEIIWSSTSFAIAESASTSVE